MESQRQRGINMDSKNIIILILSVVLIAVASLTAYMFFFNEHYETVEISPTASLEMPVGNGIKSEYINNSNIYAVYNGHSEIKEKILSYNSNKGGLSDSMAFAMLRTLYCGDVHDKIVEQDINGTHYYSIATGNNNTHDNIIITSTNKEKTQKMYESIKYSQNKSANNTNNTVEKINNDTEKQSTNSNNIPDGYKLSPQTGKYIKTVEDGKGEIRQYDLDGNLVGSSHESDQAYLREKSIAETGYWPGD